MTESSTPAASPVQPVGRCARQVCALDERERRSMRPCVRDAGHEGVCRYKTLESGRPAGKPDAGCASAGEEPLHTAPQGAMTAARELGVQYRTDCGLWRWPPRFSRSVSKPADLAPETCPLCQVVIRSEGDR